MAKEFNITDSLRQVGGKSLEKSKRLQDQANDFLKQYYDNLRESEEALELKKREDMLNGARFSNASAYMRNKERVQIMEQSIKYNNRASAIVMTDVLSTIVENALLLDADEYAEINPAYKAEIRETVLSFLENADLEKNVKNPNTLTIMEHISKNLPDVKTGIYLKEEEIVDIIGKETPEEVNKSMDELSGDVQERVANIVSKEQDEINQLDKEIDDIIAISEAKKSENVNAEEQVEGEEMVEETPEEEMEMEEVPEEEVEEAPVQEDPYEDDEYLEYQQDDQQYKPKETTISISQQGDVQLKIRESFYRETPRKGIIETLALNEGLEMVKEGKEYNGDLAIANAIMYVTILETMNATGLMDLKTLDYQKLIR